MKRLGRSFFRQKSLVVSRNLLGTVIARKIGRRVVRGTIIEVEAYPGPDDRASHAFGFKKTPRNRVEYLKGGYVYIYLVYGMYWQLNITTGKAGYPECVLIRALEPVLDARRSKKQFANPAGGPGKLCAWLKLGKSFYGEDVTTSPRLWIEPGKSPVARNRIGTSPRIGIDYAGPFWAKKPWRFYLKTDVI
jgi:DNA-3-methyladenine glycosylase